MQLPSFGQNSMTLCKLVAGQWLAENSVIYDLLQLENMTLM